MGNHRSTTANIRGYYLAHNKRFYTCKLRPEVVLTAWWRRRANLKPPLGGPTTVAIRVPLTFIVYRSQFACFRRSLLSQVETGSSSGR
jgi:hypothetical protein